MTKLLDHIKNNARMFRSAPLAFISLIILAFGAAFLAVHFLYEERFETLKERLAAKDDQLGEYRQRLQIVHKTGTSYSQLRNTELKSKTLDLVKELRRFLILERSKSDSLLYLGRDRDRDWNEYSLALSKTFSNIIYEYDDRFKVESILLRDELLSRLPQQSRKHLDYTLYEYPTNFIGMGMVADDLESLAKSLAE